MLKRHIQKRVEDCFFKGRAVIIYGARQVGKTTMIKAIQENYSLNEILYINCDEPDFRRSLTNITSTELKMLIGRRKLVFIDEAQRVKNIGITLKLMIDNFPGIQVIATGSSSLDLSNEIVEPLTGRKYEFQLFPFSFEELTQKYSSFEIRRILENRIIYGMYPEIEVRSEEAQVLLRELASSYLYKDVLQYQNIRKPELLEKAFVIFRLKPFSRNLRNEITSLRKIYFYDTGIRNALINNFNPLQLRQDIGHLWENFLISERLKRNANNGLFMNFYFWRTHQQQEIDYIEEQGGAIQAFEFKWKSGKKRAPKAFLDAYPGSPVEFVTSENFENFVGI